MEFFSFEMINYILIGIILLLIVLTVYLSYIFFIKAKNTNKVISEINNKLNNTEEYEKDTLDRLQKSYKKKRKNQANDEVDPNIHLGDILLDFDTICNDMIVGKNSSSYSMVLQCRGINFDLMSDDEKTIVEQNFYNFIKSITYPIQIHIQTRFLDLNRNFSSYLEKQKNFENEIKELIEKFKSLNQNPKINQTLISETAKEILKKQKLYNYAKDLEYQVEKMSKNSFMLQSNYYIIINFNIHEHDIQSNYSTTNNMDISYSELLKRCDSIKDSLQKCGVEANVLKSNQIVQLIYSTYNLDIENLTKLNEAMESGFFRLYSSPR